MDRYLDRLIDPWLADVLAAVPAVMITGARASGKTTTALRHAASAVRLDREREAGPFEADPLAWLRDKLGDRFKAGVVLHTGPARFVMGDRIEALPISILWS